MNLAEVSTGPLQTTLNKYNIIVLDNYGLTERTGFWWLRFIFDYELDKAIELRLTNFKHDSNNSDWTLEIVKCKYLGINNEKEMASFDMDDTLMNSKELARLQQCSTSDEKLRQYLEENVVPLVLKKIKYTRFVPKFSFFSATSLETNLLCVHLREG